MHLRFFFVYLVQVLLFQKFTNIHPMKRNLLIYFLFFVFLPSFLNAQIHWEKSYFNREDATIFDGKQIPNDSGYVMVGNRYGSQAMLFKIDKNGNDVWAKTFGAKLAPIPGASAYDVASGMTLTSDGGIVTVGTTKSFPVNTTATSIYINKFDASGNHLWSKVYGKSPDWWSGNTIDALDDGGFIIGGGFSSKGPFVMKIDLNGDIVWLKTYALGAVPVRIDAVHPTSDDNYIVAATCGGGGNDQVLIMKLNSVGDTLWTKLTLDVGITNGGVGEHRPHLIQTADGGYLWAGQTSNTNYLNPKGKNSIADNRTDAYLIKLDGAGNLEKAMAYKPTLGFDGINDEQAYTIQQTKNGNYFMSATMAGLYTYGKNVDYYAVKLDKNLKVIWAKDISGPDSSKVKFQFSNDSVICNGSDFPYVGFQTYDDGFLLAGRYNSNLLNEFKRVYIAKLSPSGKACTHAAAAMDSRLSHPKLNAAGIIIDSYSLDITNSYEEVLVLGRPETICYGENVIEAKFVFSNGCLQDSLSFTDVSDGEPVSWSWDFDDITSGTANNNSDLQNPKHVFSKAGTHAVTLTVFDKDNHFNFITHNASLQGKPTLSFTGNTTICAGESTVLSAQGALFYSWQPALGLSSCSGNPVTANPEVFTSYTLSGSSSKTCSKDTIIPLFVNPLPTLSIVPSTTLCPGASDTLHSYSNTNSIVWIPAQGLSSDKGEFVTAMPASSSTYTVTGSNECGSASVTTEVIFSPIPLISIKAKDVFVTLGFGDTLRASGGVSYTWSPGDGLSCTNCFNPLAKPIKTTTYIVTGIDANQCVSSDTLKVVVVCDNVFVPDAFSPNGDGKNDSLLIHSYCIEKLTRFDIYNRWGQKVFETNDITKGWDGTFKNEKLDPDVYFYFLEATLEVGGGLKVQGSVSLIH